MEVLVPLENAMQVGLRRTLTLDEFERLSQHAEVQLDLPGQWPPRFRVEQDILARCDAFELARLITTLTQRDGERGLASTEREILETARALLASELAVVRDWTLKKSESWLDQSLLA